MVKRSKKEFVVEQDSETEARILSAAHAVFLRRGMSGARTQEIADEAGVNKALLHYYFRTKEKLARAVFRSAVAQILPRVFAIMGSDASLEQKVRDIVSVELDFLEKHPYLPGYVVSEIHYHPDLVLEVFGERGPPPLGKLAAQLEEAAATGAIRPIAPEQFVANLMSLVLFPFVARPLLGLMLGMERDWFAAFLDERREMLADFILRGLRP
jgi:TetR/AcrR family transcriptional regulator